MSCKPAPLARYFGVDTVDFRLIDPSTFAHVVIDVQRKFCAPDMAHGNYHTHRVAGKIASALPAFRAAGIRTVIVYGDNFNDGYDNALGGPYRIEADPTRDILVPKRLNSAFTGGNLDNVLKALGVKNLFVSGFNAKFCVRETVEDALSLHYRVALVAGLIGQDKRECPSVIPRNIDYMVRLGACRTTTADALRFLHSHWVGPPPESAAPAPAAAGKERDIWRHLSLLPI